KGGATSTILSEAPVAAGAAANFAKDFATDTKALVSPDVESALTQAIKPSKNNVGFSDAVKTAVPDIVKTADTHGIKLDSLDDLNTAIAQAKKDIWNNEYAPLVKNNADATIDGNQIADAMTSAIDKRFALQNPEAAAKIQQIADTYRWEKPPAPAQLDASGNIIKPAQPGVPRAITLPEAEEFLQSANSDLHSYYAKNKE